MNLLGMSGRLNLLLRVAWALWAAAACAVANSAGLDSGRAYLARGNVERARDLFAAAYAKNPGDQTIALLYAQTIGDPQEAKVLYAELAEADAAPDSIKAVAHARLGGLAYASGDYDAAVEHYESACGRAFLPECASVLPRARRLRQHSIDMSLALEGKAALAHTRAAAERFAVQAGSYSSFENAERQKRALEDADAGAPYIVEAEVAGSKVYRVRMGPFVSRNQAQAFARRKLRSKNIPFSIVKE